MNKEWFIFKGTYHLGPFSVTEMEGLLASGELTAQSLVWREGTEKWEALGKTRELAQLFNKTNKRPEIAEVKTSTVPKLPDLPDDAPPPLPKLKSQTEAHIDFPPPIPLDALLNPEGKNKDTQTSKNSSRFWLVAAVVIFAAIVGWFFMNEKTSAIQLRVKGIMPVYLERLQETAQQKSPSIMVNMALSLDGKTLFASTNKDGEILSIIKMQSIPKRILGIEGAELMVRGIMRDHLGEFSKMQLTKGLQFVPGEYNIDFTGRKMHFLNQKFRFLNDYAFFKSLNTNYEYHTTALIYSGTPREFEKKINEYKDAIVNEKLKPLSDKLERLQTFLSLLNKTAEEYFLVLDKIKKPQEINSFEKLYIKEISPIVQSLVLAANDMDKKTEPSGVDSGSTTASYKSQILLGKQIGELASDMITETEKLKVIDAKVKSQLKTRFQERYKNIKIQIDNHLKLVQEETDKMSGF